MGTNNLRPLLFRPLYSLNIAKSCPLDKDEKEKVKRPNREWVTKDRKKAKERHRQSERVRQKQRLRDTEEERDRLRERKETEKQRETDKGPERQTTKTSNLKTIWFSLDKQSLIKRKLLLTKHWKDSDTLSFGRQKKYCFSSE